MAVWEMQIAFDIANHGIPEGPPVGTIARRPDGAWIARKEQCGKWDYRPFTNQGEWPQPDDADSWPVIYDPREGEALPQAEPCQSIDPVSELKCSQTLGHEGNHGTCSGLEWFPPGEEPRVPRPDLTDHPTREELREYFHKDLAEHCQADDPTAQQEPGESLARGLDDLAAGRVSRRDDYLEPQQEPATTHPVSPESTNCVPKPRAPRVIDRLGVDERGSRWRDRQLGEWKFDGQAWRYLELTWTSVPGGEWVEAEPSKRYGPYVEVLS
ncbi:hypothetical protein [Mycobacteroides abscessus]